MPSTMFDVKVDRTETTPLHDQVAAEIRRAIADGEAGPGERLPLAKDMAAVLGVNKNTVIRLALVAGQHAQDVHDERVAFSPSDPGGPIR